MSLLNPTVDQTKITALAKVAIEAVNARMGADTPELRLEAVYALCLATAQIAVHAGVSHAEDVADQVKRMMGNLEAARAEPGRASPRLSVVSPEQFRKIAGRFGVKF
jgi:hypothetical protein